jgi:hypothetical protein
MPAVVNKAVILLYVVQFAGLIRIIVHLLVGTTPAERASPIVLMLSIANAIGMIFWLLGKIDNGQTWARNTYLNLFILGALISLPKIIKSFPSPPISTGFTVLVDALQIIGLAMLFSPGARPWFDKSTSLPPRH